MKKECYVVNFTHGSRIRSRQFNTYKEAFEHMKWEFNALIPENMDEVDERDMRSYLDDYDAFLYVNKDNIFCWNIFKVNLEDK